MSLFIEKAEKAQTGNQCSRDPTCFLFGKLPWKASFLDSSYIKTSWIHNPSRFFVGSKYLNYYLLWCIIVWTNSGLEKWSHHHLITDRRSKAVAKFVGESELNMARWEELSIVLNGDQTRVQGGGLTITQGRGLWTYPAPVSWRTKRWEDKSAMCGCGRVQLQPIITRSEAAYSTRVVDFIELDSRLKIKTRWSVTSL